MNQYGHPFDKWVYSMQFYESIVCFHVDRPKCFFGKTVENGKTLTDAKDLHFEDHYRMMRPFIKVKLKLESFMRFLGIEGIKNIIAPPYRKVYKYIFGFKEKRILKKYF